MWGPSLLAVFITTFCAVCLVEHASGVAPLAGPVAQKKSFKVGLAPRGGREEGGRGELRHLPQQIRRAAGGAQTPSLASKTVLVLGYRLPSSAQ